MGSSHVNSGQPVATLSFSLHLLQILAASQYYIDAAVKLTPGYILPVLWTTSRYSNNIVSLNECHSASMDRASATAKLPLVGGSVRYKSRGQSPLSANALLLLQLCFIYIVYVQTR